jgi:hypothetical protein
MISSEWVVVLAVFLALTRGLMAGQDVNDNAGVVFRVVRSFRVVGNR